MATKQIKDLTEKTTVGANDVYAIDDGATNVTYKVKASTLLGVQSDGTVLNGKISVTVSSNNLTVALKTLAGDDPSATSPVFVKINGSLRTVTSALSVTKNAGTNWCNSGSSELATKEVDYFVYLGYNATNGVVIGFSRIPYATLYSDFSTTTTNEKYAGISTITSAAAGDNYVNIGRFAATLSAGAGYTWTVPTFTSANLVQRPVYETRWLSWLPTIAGYSANPTDVVYIYKVSSNQCELFFREATSGTSNNATHTYTAPFTAVTRTNMVWGGGNFVPFDNGANGANGVLTIVSASNSVSFQLSARASHTASGASRVQWASLWYEV